MRYERYRCRQEQNRITSEMKITQAQKIGGKEEASSKENRAHNLESYLPMRHKSLCACNLSTIIFG